MKIKSILVLIIVLITLLVADDKKNGKTKEEEKNIYKENENKKYIPLYLDILNTSTQESNRIYAIEQLIVNGKKSTHREDVLKALYWTWKNDKAKHSQSVKVALIGAFSALNDYRFLLTVLRNDKEDFAVKDQAIKALGYLAKRGYEKVKTKIPVIAIIRQLISNLENADLQTSAINALTDIGCEKNKVILELHDSLKIWIDKDGDKDTEGRASAAVQVLLNIVQSIEAVQDESSKTEMAKISKKKNDISKVLIYVYGFHKNREVARTCLENIEYINPHGKEIIEAFIRAARNYPEDYALDENTPIAARILGGLTNAKLELIEYYDRKMDDEAILKDAIQDVLDNRHKANLDNLRKCEEILVIRAMASSGKGNILLFKDFKDESTRAYIMKVLLEYPCINSIKVVGVWFLESSTGNLKRDTLHVLAEMIKKTGVKKEILDNIKIGETDSEKNLYTEIKGASEQNDHVVIKERASYIMTLVPESPSSEDPKESAPQESADKKFSDAINTIKSTVNNAKAGLDQQAVEKAQTDILAALNTLKSHTSAKQDPLKTQLEAITNIVNAAEKKPSHTEQITALMNGKKKIVTALDSIAEALKSK